MISLLLVTALSFGLAVVAMPIARVWAFRCGLVDEPDGQRKLHDRPIPMGGGMVVLLSTTITLVACLLVANPLTDRLVEQGTTLLGLLLAALVICSVGLADDFQALRGRHKLLGQLLAVGTVIGAGVEIRTIYLFGYHVELGLLALPFTALWLLAAINSLNLIDGMDGLLSTLAVTICVTLTVLAVACQQWAVAAVACALAGSLLAFLCYNFPPATIFLGDCGSMFVGLVIGVLTIQGSLKAPGTVSLAAPAVLLTIPFFDTLAAITRRTLTGRSIYMTDRGHIHHCLQRQGLSRRRTLTIVSSLCLVTAAGTLASFVWDSEWCALASGLAVVGLLVATRVFGYAEFLLIKERVRSCWVRTATKQVHHTGHQMRVHLQGSTDWETLWQTMTVCAGHLDLRSLYLDVNAPVLHEGYHARWDSGNGDIGHEENLWRAEIPLLVQGRRAGRLECTGRRDDSPSPIGDKVAKMAELAEEVERILSRLMGPTSVMVATPNGSPREASDFALRLLAQPADATNRRAIGSPVDAHETTCRNDCANGRAPS